MRQLSQHQRHTARSGLRRPSSHAQGGLRPRPAARGSLRSPCSPANTTRASSRRRSLIKLHWMRANVNTGHRGRRSRGARHRSLFAIAEPPPACANDRYGLCPVLAPGLKSQLVPTDRRRPASGSPPSGSDSRTACDSFAVSPPPPCDSLVTLGLANDDGERRNLARRRSAPYGRSREAARPGEAGRRPSYQWAGQDSNLRAMDYESTALTPELPAPNTRCAARKATCVLTRF